MNSIAHEGGTGNAHTTRSLSIHTEHGPLHGLLTLVPEAGALIVLAHAGTTPATHDEALATVFQHAGLATLSIDLLAHHEERFNDVHNNVPLLARRLLDCLSLLKRQMLTEELPSLPLGLCGAGYSSPVVLRVAALRDHDITAVVCRGGLIDLAGMLYLRSLESPLLVLLGEMDGQLLISNRRALAEVGCRKALKIIAHSDSNFASTQAGESVATEAAHWFAAYSRAPSP